jgi:hypothetical protein
MVCAICNKSVDVVAHVNNVEICLICMAKAQKYAFNYGRKFTDVVAKQLAKAGNN